MKERSKRHSLEQIAKKLRDSEIMLASSKSMDKVLKMSKVSAATLNRWRNQYGAIKSEEANRLKRLDGEIARLKRLPVEADIDRAMLKKKLRGND